MKNPLRLKRAISLGALGAAAVGLLGGCGGASTSNTAVRPTVPSTVAIFGLHGTAAAQTGSFRELSGLALTGSGGNTSGGSILPVVTGAVDSNAVPASSEQFSPTKTLGNDPASPAPCTGAGNCTVPLGFAPGGQYLAASSAAPGGLGVAASPGASVIFRAALASGTAANGANIAPRKVFLTSGETAWAGIAGLKTDDPADAPNGYLPMGFNADLTGPLANGTFVTGAPDSGNNAAPTAFSLPFTTTGLHSLTVFAFGSDGGKIFTKYLALMLAPGDSAVVVQVVDAGGNPVPGAQAVISGRITPAAPAADQTTTDAQGVAILFAAPGPQTLTVTGTSSAGNAVTGQDTLTLTAGQAFVAARDGNGNPTANPYTITAQ